MTDQGTFIINGAERVVVSQLVRSPGVYYTAIEDPATGRPLYSAKVIPNRGAWLEFETAARHQLYVKVDRKRKLEATKLLRAVGYESNEEMVAPVRQGRHGRGRRTSRRPSRRTAPTPARKRSSRSTRSCARATRPPATTPRSWSRACSSTSAATTSAGSAATSSTRSWTPSPSAWASSCRATQRTISREDIAAIVGQLIELNNGLGQPDDIDHLGNRRIRANGELIQNAFRVGLLRMERVVKERMTIQEVDKATPNALINIRPVVAAMKEFFGGSQLSQFMDQTNPLAELTSKRRLSALGPGRPVARARRLRRARRAPQPLRPHLPHRDAGRSEHRPDRLARHLRPDQRVRLHRDALPQGQAHRRLGRPGHRPTRSRTPTSPTKSGKVVLKKGKRFTADAVAELKKQKASAFPIRPRVTDEIVYLAAYDEEERYVAQANAAPRRRGPLRGRARAGTPPRPVPRGAPAADRVHGREPQAGRLGGHRAHPVPGARRRQPRPDGLEHAAPGGAAAASPRRPSWAPAWRRAPRRTPARCSSPGAPARCCR